MQGTSTQTIERVLYSLKSGDCIRFQNRWRIVFDVEYMGPGRYLLKLENSRDIIDEHIVHLSRQSKILCKYI